MLWRYHFKIKRSLKLVEIENQQTKKEKNKNNFIIKFSLKILNILIILNYLLHKTRILMEKTSLNTSNY